MSKRPFRSQASSSRAATVGSSGGFGASAAATPFASAGPTSTLSYLAEPPDLSGISDANLAVAFKNLNKKDSTTKTKALEDIQASLSDLTEPEEAILEAWTGAFPRTSIDSARRVRQLAHTVNGAVAVKSGKRVAKYMPRLVATWLAGLYDNDKLVAKAAHDALVQVFATREKVQTVRKAYQEQILAIVRQIIENESPQTLSDERAISPDEALEKYNRVVTAAIGLFSSLLSNLSREDREKFSALYSELLESKKLWEFAVNGDSAVRRTVHKCLKTYLSSDHELSDATSNILSTIYVYKALDSDQSASASDYVDALSDLTRAVPGVWTTYYTGKKSADRRLRHFLERGSQAAAANYWSSVSGLFDHIPTEVLPKASKDVVEMVQSLHSGITRKDEPRSYLTNGYKAYFYITGLILHGLPEDQIHDVLQTTMLPIIKEYTDPISLSSKNALPSTTAANLIVDLSCVAGVDKMLLEELPSQVSLFTEDLKKSLPEQSKDYTRSQDELQERGSRLSTILVSIIENVPGEELSKVVDRSVTEIIDTTISVCASRNGKPYSAARTLTTIVSTLGLAVKRSDSWSRVDEFVSKQSGMLIMSPSAQPLVDLLRQHAERPRFQDATAEAIEVLTTSQGSRTPSQHSYLSQLLTIPLGQEQQTKIQSVITAYLQKLVDANLNIQGGLAPSTNAWDDIGSLVNQQSINSNAFDEILTTLTSQLSLESEKVRLLSALQGLLQIARHASAAFSQYLTTSHGKDLLPKVLLLTEASDREVADMAADLSSAVQGGSSTNGVSSSASQLQEVIESGLNEASSDSVSVETLVDQSKRLLPADGKSTVILPNPAVWAERLQVFWSYRPDPALAISHPLGGAMNLIDSDPARLSESNAAPIPRDSQGLSVPMRMLTYTTRLLRETGMELANLDPALSPSILELMLLTLQLANDNLSIRMSNGIWVGSAPEIESDVVETVSQAQTLVASALSKASSWWDQTDESDHAFVRKANMSLFGKATNTSVESYYNALAACVVVSELAELHGTPANVSTMREENLRPNWRSRSLFQNFSYIVAHKSLLGSSAAAHRLCNEAVADLTGMGGARNASQVPRQLVQLNTFVQNIDGCVKSIAKQRLIFFVKAAIDMLKAGEAGVSSQTEISKALGVLMPEMRDMYGDYWADVLAYIAGVWSALDVASRDDNERNIPLLHSTLKLYIVLRRLKEEPEANEDLAEAWEERQTEMNQSLLQAMHILAETADDGNQPARIVNELVARQLRDVSVKSIKNAEDFFAVLTSVSAPLQEAAYDILHKFIPTQQEQVSFDAALENKAARLPNELLSLILDAPTVQETQPEIFEQGVPLNLRAYCFSWLLVFDHFENSVSRARV